MRYIYTRTHLHRCIYIHIYIEFIIYSSEGKHSALDGLKWKCSTFLLLFCQRSWESGHTRIGIGDGDQLLADHIFDHQMYLWGTWEPTVKTGTTQGVLQRPKDFRQLQQLLCSFLENWAGSRFGDPEQHHDQPVLQPGFPLKIELESV